MKEKLTSGVQELQNTAGKLNTTFTGLSGSNASEAGSMPAGGGGGSAAGSECTRAREAGGSCFDVATVSIAADRVTAEENRRCMGAEE